MQQQKTESNLNVTKRQTALKLCQNSIFFN